MSLEDRIAALEKRIAELEPVAKVTPARVIQRSANPCEYCQHYGRYRCYDGPLECPKFYRWAMRGNLRPKGEAYRVDAFDNYNTKANKGELRCRLLAQG